MMRSWELKCLRISNYSSPEKGGRRILFWERRWGSHGFRGTLNGDQSLLAEYKEETLLSVSLVAPIFSLLPSFLPWQPGHAGYGFLIGSIIYLALVTLESPPPPPTTFLLRRISMAVSLKLQVEGSPIKMTFYPWNAVLLFIRHVSNLKYSDQSPGPSFLKADSS